MSRRLAWMLGAAALVSSAHAQSSAPPPQSSASVPLLRSSTQLVVVDVVVRDQDGHPVRGLKQDNFRLSEGGVAQTVGHVEEHSSLTPSAPRVALPPEPPGVFTDYTQVPPDSTLNILLIDALNTPVKDQAFIRNQLRQYVKEADPHTRIAVFGLANRLILLQGFTSDPAVLRDVVERKLIARSSSLVHSEGEKVTNEQRISGKENESVAVTATGNNGSPSTIDLAANLRQFQTEMGSMETQLRAQYTLDAFNTLAHYLAGFSGRKNLIWFSGSFPLSILPDPTSTHSPDVSSLDQAEFRETVNLFSKAQVAVYPIDARGLMTQPAHGAIAPGSSAPASQPRRTVAEVSKFTQSEAAEHAMMDDLAASTGGRSFYNLNDLASAVSSAVSAGADYYTLSYTPANTKEDGGYRPIRVETVGVVQKLQLFYRRGYYARDASNAPNPAGKSDTSAPTADEGRAAAYRHAVLSRGAPTPEDVLFKVRVLPFSASTETVAAAGNQLSVSIPASGPFRRYAIDYISTPGVMTFVPGADGHRIAKVEFLALVYDTEGRLLNEAGKAVSMETTAANFARLMHEVIRCRLEVSVPDRAETFLRIAVRDVTSNRFGVIEVPVSSLSSLPPVPSAGAPPSGRATPPKD